MCPSEHARCLFVGEIWMDFQKIWEGNMDLFTRAPGRIETVSDFSLTRNVCLFFGKRNDVCCVRSERPDGPHRRLDPCSCWTVLDERSSWAGRRPTQAAPCSLLNWLDGAEAVVHRFGNYWWCGLKQQQTWEFLKWLKIMKAIHLEKWYSEKK